MVDENPILLVLRDFRIESGEFFLLGEEGLGAVRTGGADRDRLVGEAEVAVVLAQAQAILRPAREHAIRLRGAASHQIVQEDTDVGLISAED